MEGVRVAIIGKATMYTPARIEGEGIAAKPHGRRRPVRWEIFCPYCRTTLMGQLHREEWAPTGSAILYGSKPDIAPCGGCGKTSILPWDGIAARS